MIKILIVDDEPGLCEIIQRTFTYVGFSVLTATTAKKASSLIEKESPKIIFLDVMLPDADGLELLKQIKQKDPGIIVLLITAKNDDATRQKALELGANDFISKPFSHNYLRDVVVQKVKEVLDKGGHMQKPTILIVDDEKDARQNLNTFISHRFECVLEEAEDGVSAIEKVGRLKPDVILIDIKMPGMSGIDAISEIKKISPQSKIIVISAWKSAEVVSQAVKSGATDYLSKPIALTVLGDKLKSVLISMGKLILKKK